MLTFSNSDMWTACAISTHPETELNRPEITQQQSDARREGNAADWLANMVLRGDAATAEEGAGETAPNGWPIDAAMVRHIQDYIDIVTRHGTPRPQVDAMLFNGRVTGRPDNHTVDGDILRVYELKYGYKIKEPYGNTQLLLGALAFFRPGEHRLISLEVFQPRPHHPSGKHRKWVLDGDELMKWAAWLEGCVERAYGENPIATPGDQCNYCARRGGCHSLMANVNAAFEIIATNHTPRPLPAADLGHELGFLTQLEKMLKARKSGIATEALARAKKGEFIPGWMLEEKFGDRRWTNEDVEMRRILTGVDPHKKVLKSPAEVEKEGGNVDHLAKQPFVGVGLKPFKSTVVERKFKT